MKIDTLVEDIYKLVGGGIAPATSNHNVAVDYSKWFSKEEKVREDKTLFFSEIGDPCVRKLWYKVNAPALGEQVSSDMKVKFFYGDMLEELVLKLCEDAGHEVSGKQERVSFDIGDGWQVRGRMDAVIDGVPVDVKSVTKFSEEKFKGGLKDDPFGYYHQLCGYATALSSPTAGFLTIQKELGHINYYPIEVNSGLFKLQAVHAVEAVTSKLEDLPRLDPVPQSATSKNAKLCTSCSYCAYKKDCWKEANEGKGLRTFLYSTGPVFLTKVEDLPRVMEVVDA